MTDKIHAFFVAFDAIASEIALRFRRLIKSVFSVLLGIQAVLLLELPVMGFLNYGRWPTVVGLMNALIGYYTFRSAQQARDLVEVQRIGGSAAVARVPSQPTTPMFPPSESVGSVIAEDEKTPRSMPIQTRLPRP